MERMERLQKGFRTGEMEECNGFEP